MLEILLYVAGTAALILLLGLMIGGPARRRVFPSLLAAVLAGAAIIFAIQYFILGDRSVRTFWRGELVATVAYSPDGRTALAGSASGMLKLWEVATGKELRNFSAEDSVPRAHSDWVYSVAISPDGRTALSGSWDYRLKLWDLATGRALRTFVDATITTFIPDDQPNWAHKGQINSVVFSRDGLMALSGGEETIRLWDVSTGKLVRIFTGHKGPVYAVAISPDGRTALSGGADDTLRVWEVATGKELHTMAAGAFRLVALAFSPDGKTALAGGYNGTLRLWEVASAKPLHSFSGHAGAVNSVAFSPDGRFALFGGGASLTGGGGPTVKLSEVATGRHLQTFAGHLQTISAVAFSPDGRAFLTAARDGIKLWELKQP